MARSQTSTISLFLLFSVLVISLSGVAADQCESSINIGDKRRSTRHRLALHEVPLSDNKIDPNAWYRFESPTGNKIPDHPVKSYQCGTNSPIWINGTHPTEAQPGPVTLNACAQLRCDEDLCGWPTCVEAKWCKNSTTGLEFFVYRLIAPPVEGMAYCAGDIFRCGVDCTLDKETSKCNCPPQPPITKPTLSPPSISTAATDIDPSGKAYVASKFKMLCTVGYPVQEVDDGARFQVQFQADGVTFFTSFAQSTNPFVILDESRLSGQMGKNINARVLPYWKDDKPDPAVFQDTEGIRLEIKPFMESGVEVTSPVILKEGEVFKFQMVANFPITAPNCFNTSLNVSCHPSYIFKIFAPKDGLVDSCAFQMIPGSNASDFISIMPVPSIGKRVPNFVWEISFEKKVENNLFLNYQIPPITVHIEDQVIRPKCDSLGDPHITTFPVGDPLTRTLFHNFETGDYYLVRAEKRNFSIQVRQFPCVPTATCNCAVAVREGNNALIIDGCLPPEQQPAPADYHPRLVRLLGDKTHPSGSITENGNTYVINTLSGVEVTVLKQYADKTKNFLDVTVTGLNTDNYTGLCSFNPPGAGHICKDDCDKYRVPDEENLFNFNEANPPKCVETYSLPACVCDAQEGDKYCKAGDVQPDQSNLLKSGLVCFEQTQYRVATEEDYLNIIVQVQVNITAGGSRSNFEPVWPTPSGITRDQAIEKCNSVVASSKFQSVCGNRSDINTDGLITGCAMDIQIIDSLLSAETIEMQYETSCQYSIDSSKVETNDANGSLIENIATEQYERIKSAICARACSHRGKCENGTCVCDAGYAGRSCALVEGQVPTIQRLAVDTCDLKNRSCSQIYVLATNVSINSETLTCQLNSTIDQIQFDRSPFTNNGIIICTLPSKPNVDIYQVSVSNDGTVFSQSAQFTVYISEDEMPSAPVSVAPTPAPAPAPPAPAPPA